MADAAAPAPAAAAPVADAPRTDGAPVVDKGYQDIAAELRAYTRAKPEERARMRGEDPAAVDAVEGEGEGKEAADAIEGEQAPDGEKPEDAEPADEAKPHWAKALKQDLETAKADVEQFKQREEQWNGALREVNAKIADATQDVSFYKSLFEQAKAYLEKIGHPINPHSLAVAERDREIARMKRQMSSGQQVDQQAQRQQHTAQIAQRIDALIAKHPELDYRKNEAAKAFIVSRLRSGTMDGFEDDAQAWLEVQRGKAMRAAQANQKKTPRATQSTTLANAQPASGGQSSRRESNNPFGVVDEKSIRAQMARHRAAR